MSIDRISPLSTGEIAKYCHVSPVTVYHWVKDGKIKAFATPGGHYRVLPSDFRDFLVRNLMPVPPVFRERKERRLLVVDDDEGMLEVIRAVAEGLEPKIAVRTAMNGYHACLALGAEPAAAALVDLKMPGMDGLELCRALRTADATREMAIVVVSGFRDEEAARALAGIGVTRHLDKPFAARELETLLRELFG